MGGNTKVDPKSGCLKIKNIGHAKQSPNFEIPFKESLKVPISDRDNILAPSINVTILANSEGCNLKKTKSIHR